MSVGLAEFRIIVVILFIIEGAKVALSHQPANRLANLLVSVAVVYALLTYYVAPAPWGRNLVQTVTDAGTALAQNIDTSIDQQVATAVSNVYGNISGSVWDIVTNAAQATRYFVIVFALCAIQVAILFVISFGFIAVGVLALIGPVLIPWMLVPQMDWLFWGWFKSLLQYAAYPVIGNAFVYIIGTVWINFMNGINGPMDSTTIASLVTQIVVISFAGVLGILKVPALVSGIFNGSSGISSFNGVGWWK